MATEDRSTLARSDPLRTDFTICVPDGKGSTQNLLRWIESKTRESGVVEFNASLTLKNYWTWYLHNEGAARHSAARVELGLKLGHRGRIQIEFFANCLTALDAPEDQRKLFKGLATKLFRSVLEYVSKNYYNTPASENYDTIVSVVPGNSAPFDFANEDKNQARLVRHYTEIGFKASRFSSDMNASVKRLMSVSEEYLKKLEK